ncbi:unnamed protein product [Calypogeia fissa]
MQQVPDKYQCLLDLLSSNITTCRVDIVNFFEKFISSSTRGLRNQYGRRG